MKNTHHKIDFAATTFSILAALCWCFGPIFIKLLTQYLDSWSQNFLRYSAAAVFLLPFLIYAHSKGRVDKSLWRKAIPIAVINIIMQSLWAAAFYFINPGFMMLLAQSSILWVCMFSILMFADERSLLKSKRFWTGFFMTLTGVIGIIIFKSDFGVKATLTGILLSLTSSFFWGLYVVFARATFKNSDVRISFSIITIYTSIALGVLACIFSRPQEYLKITPVIWGYIIVSGLFSITLSHTLFYAAINRIGTMIPSLVKFTQLFIVLIISWIIFKEKLNLLQWLFGIVLIIGAAISIWAQEHLKKD